MYSNPPEFQEFLHIGSFSALRRLKTWLCSTMTKTRLNAVSVCHVHQQKLDCIVIRQLMHQFVACNDECKSNFGIIEL
jgi:hypothetical protein